MSFARVHNPIAGPVALRGEHRSHFRAGHTLVEILLALALSLIILAAVYAALDQHWRYAEAGQSQTERMQVTRALFERISLDLRSVAFRSAAGRQRFARRDGSTRVNVVQSIELYSGPSFGIVGDAEKLAMRIDAPGDGPFAGARTVRWEVRTGSSDRRERGRTEASRLADAAPITDEVAGLARVARADGALASLQNSMPVMPQELLATEVKTIRFRYFARGQWFTSWDSARRAELPRAVEVTIGFHDVMTGAEKSSDANREGEYQLVVPVPASEA